MKNQRLKFLRRASDFQVPGRVAMFEVEERGSGQFLVSWDPPSEPNGVLVGYTIGYRLGM